MQTFTVVQIVDGDTFAVSPEWRWNGASGDRVRPKGYDAPEVGTFGASAATQRLFKLLAGKNVELKNAVTIDRGRIVCDVYLDGRNLAHFFPRHQT